jgi:hypothetical protein
MKFIYFCLSVTFLASAVVVGQFNGHGDLPPPSSAGNVPTDNNQDENCIELDALKEYYCTTDKCKDFYTKGCYEKVNNQTPNCGAVKKCMEDRIEHYKNKAEKKHSANSAFSSAQPSSLMIIPVITFSVLNSFKLL